MYVTRILCPVVTLGPGRRLVIWTQGCSKHCPGCISPEMKERRPENNIPVEDLIRIIENIYHQEGFDGITISGGDPLEQLEELRTLLQALHGFTQDILVYTGYVWAEFADTLPEDVREELCAHISVLIDGPYREEENYPQLTLRGSANQRIYYFDESVREKYEVYLKQGRTLENFFIDNTFLTIGIMDR